MRRMLCLGYIMLVFSGKDTFIQAHFVRLKDNKFETRPALMGYCYKKKKKIYCTVLAISIHRIIII